MSLYNKAGLFINKWHLSRDKCHLLFHKGQVLKVQVLAPIEIDECLLVKVLVAGLHQI